MTLAIVLPAIIIKCGIGGRGFRTGLPSYRPDPTAVTVENWKLTFVANTKIEAAHACHAKFKFSVGTSGFAVLLPLVGTV